MALKNFNKTIAETPEEVGRFVEHSMDILERIHELLDEKFDGKQKVLADKLGKSEAEISKILNGVQNFTLKTISKLEEAFGAKIIAVCTNDREAEFIPVKTPSVKGCIKVVLTRPNGPEKVFDGIAIKVSSPSALKTTMHSAS